MILFEKSSEAVFKFTEVEGGPDVVWLKQIYIFSSGYKAGM